MSLSAAHPAPAETPPYVFAGVLLLLGRLAVALDTWPASRTFVRLDPTAAEPEVDPLANPEAEQRAAKLAGEPKRQGKSRAWCAGRPS